MPITDKAFEAMKAKNFDCVILDLTLPDLSGYELLRKMEESQLRLPVIVYTGSELSAEQQSRLKRSTQTIIVKDAYSPVRLLAETSLLLHRSQNALPAAHKQLLRDTSQIDPLLAHKEVLVVDDDVRNIFALMSILESQQMKVGYAESGKEAIEFLKGHSKTDVVLMDIMMPEMDGYQTIAAIRGMPNLKALPIIAVTAKAMRGDRDKCIDAGATDYIAKPVDSALLFSLLRVYLGDSKKEPESNA